jgi:hypothetical protein
MSTPTRILADHLLDGGLDAYIERKRADGRSWRKIALDLRDDTNRAIDVTWQTLHNWYPQYHGDDERAVS